MTEAPSAASLRDYQDRGVPGVLVDRGQPEVRWVVEPSRARLGLWTPAEPGRSPDVEALVNVEHELVDQGGVVWHRLWLRHASDLEAAHGVLQGVRDRLREGRPFAEAVEEALQGVAALLDRRELLSEERQVGLFAELLVVHTLARELGPDAAVLAWQGPLGEEHDFVLGDEDLEVKATRSERRQHWISTLTQLRPNEGRPLLLLSLQLTGAGAGPGLSLPESVEALRRIVAIEPLGSRLERVGYRDEDARTYRQRWRLRTPVAFFAVDERFPAITPDRLDAVPGRARITDVRYRVDLTDLGQVSPLFPVQVDDAEV